RYHGMLAEIAAPPETLLLTTHSEEDDRPPGTSLAEPLGEPHQPDCPGAVVIRTIVDAVPLPRGDADVIHMCRVDEILALESRIAALEDAHGIGSGTGGQDRVVQRDTNPEALQ